MSRRDNMSRIYVGNLPPDVRTRDLEDIFYKFGKIAFIDLKTRRGPPFAFVEFVDYRDAQDAVRSRDGKEFDGYRLRVEFPRGSERRSNYNRNGASKSSRIGVSSGGGGGGGPPQRRSKHRVLVTGLPPSGSWQDLKDHMREIGEVCFADVYKGGEGVVEFLRYDDMKYALKKMNNTKFKSHEGETTYIRLREDSGGDSRSRSRSRSRSITPIAKKRGSPSYSPARKRSPSDSRSRSRSRSRTRSRSRSVTRSRSRSVSRSRSRSRTPASRSRSRSRTRSRTRSRSRSVSRSRSRTPSRSKSRSKSPTRSRSRSRSVSRSHSRSRSPSRSKSLSKTPEVDRKPSLSPEAKRPTPETREAHDDQ